MAYFFNFGVFLRILAILGVACHVRLSAIDFKNHPNAHGTSLATIIQLYKIWNLPRAEVTSSQMFIFYFQNTFRGLTSSRVCSYKQNVKRNLDITVGKLNKFATNNVETILCQIASFGVKITTKKRQFSQKSVKIFPRLMTSS